MLKNLLKRMDVTNGDLAFLVVCLIVVEIVRRFVFFLAIVPSGSMLPTIQIGNRLAVVRRYSPAHIERGDIILFNSKELREMLVKRAIGLPGDVVEMKNGIVYVNGSALDELYLSEETKTMADLQEDFAVTVPQGSYFFLGDNRLSSRDSRFWKQPFIPQSEIIGEAMAVIWPLSQAKTFSSVR